MVKLIPAVRLFPWVDNVLRCSRDYKQLLLVLTSHNENGNNENCCSTSSVFVVEFFFRYDSLG